MMNLEFRPARFEDYTQVVPLIHESSRDLIDFCFALTAQSADGFLAHDFKRGKGIFGYLNQRVAITPNGEVHGTMTVYRSTDLGRLNQQSLLSIFSYFGWIQSFRVIYRMLLLSRQFQRPRADSVFIANVCVAARHRGKGICSALMNASLKPFQASGFNTAELDVSPSNSKAQRLYEYLGFQVVHESKNFRRMAKDFKDEKLCFPPLSV